MFLENEKVLPDDYPVYLDYVYIADGKIVKSPLHETTVADLKRELGVSEIRSCDIVSRREMKIGDVISENVR